MEMTPAALRVLLVERSIDEGALIVRALERGGYLPQIERVADEAAMAGALAAGGWDLVIADHSLPGSDPIRALATLRTLDPDVGCIVLSGGVGEEEAVAVMRAGADDCLRMERLEALAASVERTRAIARVRREHRRAEWRYRTLVESAPDGMVTTDRAGIITSLNPAFEVMCGMPIAAAVGRHFSEFVHRDDAAAMAAGFEDALRSSDPIRAQVRVLNRGGIYFHAELTVSRLLDGSTTVGLFTIFRDISERRVMEQELRLGEARLRTLINSAPDGIFTVNAAGEVSGSNPALQRLLGADQVRPGRHFRDLVHPEDLARAHEIFARRLKGETIPPYEIRLLDAAGRSIEVEITSSALLEGTRIAGSLGIVRDITLRKQQAEEEARLQQALHAAAADWTVTFDAVPMIVLLVGADLRIRRLNRAAREAIGRPWGEIVDRRLDDLPGPPWEQIVALTRAAFVSGAPVVEQVEDAASGRSWSILAAPVATSVGLQATIAARDTTDLADLQRTIAHDRTMAALGALVAGVAHEVRNPLFAISATLDAFEARYAGQPEFAKYAKNLRPEVTRLSVLMHDLLEYGRPASLQPAEGDLRGVIGEGVALVAAAAKAHDVRIVVEGAERPMLLSFDPARMLQVVQNLLDNALGHTPSGSVLTIRIDTVREGGQSWGRLAIEDEGTGFRTADLPHVFEPFYSLRRGGTGLGLSIVDRLVRQHGGRVIAENRVNGGARVIVLLPKDGS